MIFESHTHSNDPKQAGALHPPVVLRHLNHGKHRDFFVCHVYQKLIYLKVHDPHTTCLKCFRLGYYTISLWLDFINISDYAKFHQNIASSLPCQ